MRKGLLLILFSLLIAGVLFASPPPPEGEETYNLILVDSSGQSFDFAPGAYETRGFDTYQELLIAEFLEENPNITIDYVHRDVTQGSMTTDAMFAKGTPPDVWVDAGGYFRDLFNVEDLLPLEEYMDVSVYQDHLVDTYTFDGHVFALVFANNATGMAINTSMLDEIGYTMPAQEDWTIAEYIRLADKLKANGEYVTTVFTQEGFGSWMYPWIYAFGGKLFEPGDYSKVVINTPESREALDWLKMLVDEGYAMPYPNEIDDDLTVDLFTTGKLFSAMMQNGHTDYWIPEQVKNGTLAEEFGYTFVEFPHAPGVAHTPVYGYQTVITARQTGDEGYNLANIALLKKFSGERQQTYMTTLSGAFSSLKNFEMPAVGLGAAPSKRAIAELAPAAGLMDLGGMHPRADEVLAAATIPIQEFMDGDITAQQFLDQFEAEANRILSE